MRNFILIVLVVFLSGFHAPALAAVESVPGEVVVKLKSSAAFSAIAKSLNVVSVNQFATSSEFALVKIKSGASVEQAIEKLNSNPQVEYAEPNYIYHHTGINMNAAVNDPMLNQLWSYENSGQADHDGNAGKAGSDIKLLPLWNEGITGSKSIKVAVIDTGADLTHPDLAANIWTNPGEIPGNGIDDDGDGFIDDVHGWNFVANNSNPNDDHNHGSHCSGVIGAVSNNGQGIAGINWNVAIVPIKFLDATGSGSLAAAVQAIQYATKVGVQVMSNSWSGGGYSQALYDAIADAKKKGILFVAAAGNSSLNSDLQDTFPANYQLDNIVAVAATDNQDGLAYFSNYGRTKVHVAAPGVDIVSLGKAGTYMPMSGTSMATPHVAGIAALMLSANSKLNYSEIKDILIRSSDPVRVLGNKVISKGRVNAYNAIHQIYPAPVGPDPSRWQDYSFSLESTHPYENNLKWEREVEVPGAKYIRIIFDSIDTEAGYDKITVTDSGGDEIERLSGQSTNYATEYLVGPKFKINFTSDGSISKYGFKIGKLQVIY